MSEKCEHCHGTGRELDQAALGLKLRKLREKSGKFTKEVAMTMGISASLLSCLESGTRRWSLSRKLAFIDAISDVVK